MRRRGHPVFARVYSKFIVPALRQRGSDRLRERLLAGLSGTVVEVGAGDGANFYFYPEGVERVVAVEPEPFLRERATDRSGRVGDGRIEVVDADGTALPVADGSADAVVFSLVLCSVRDQAATLAEARRVLRPGGELRVLEHVLAHEPGGTRRLQRALDATVWPWFGGGCHCSRDTAAAVESAGFAFDDLDRFTMPEGSRGPEASMILGTARSAS